MGADKPKVRKPGIKTRLSLPLFLLGATVLLFVVALFRVFDFQWKSETPTLSPRDEEKLQKRLREIDEAEQYALFANEDGWYPCNHPGRTTFYLLAGEVWKYGATTKGQFGRYSAKFLEKTNVSFIIQLEGTIADCLKEEQRKLFNYPYLPENLARPENDRLPRPPYNSKMQ